ncbi:MAG: AAA family ATPase [Acidiferrobacter thiooxydans]|jgi:dethiobiotin synthetase
MGTDTGTGKTLVCGPRPLGYAKRGDRVSGLKPIAPGMVEGRVYEDVEAQRRASVPVRACRGASYRAGLAPYFAAAQAGPAVDLAAAVRVVQGVSPRGGLARSRGLWGFWGR